MPNTGYIAGLKRARAAHIQARIDALVAAEQATGPEMTRLALALVNLTRRVDDVAVLQAVCLASLDAERVGRAKRERRVGFVVGALSMGLAVSLAAHWLL